MLNKLCLGLSESDSENATHHGIVSSNFLYRTLYNAENEMQ